MRGLIKCGANCSRHIGFDTDYFSRFATAAEPEISFRSPIRLRRLHFVSRNKAHAFWSQVSADLFALNHTAVIKVVFKLHVIWVGDSYTMMPPIRSRPIKAKVRSPTSPIANVGSGLSRLSEYHLHFRLRHY